MGWSKEETSAAAEKAVTLSELLRQDNFYKDGLQWLRLSHIDKFDDVIDEQESIRLQRFASTWHYPKENGTNGFPLLDRLWVIGPAHDWQRVNLVPSDGPGGGHKLVAHLAEFQAEWVGRWWQWRCQNGQGKIYPKNQIETALISALSAFEFESFSTQLADEVVAIIIGRRPAFIEFLPNERRGPMLRAALHSTDVLSRRVVEAFANHAFRCHRSPQ